MTFHFGRASTQRLNTCHMDIQAIMSEALAMSDVDITIVCGERNREDQEAAYPKFSKARFGQSPHNFKVTDDGGVPAVDVAPYKDGEIQWSDKKLFHRIADFIMVANDKLIDEGVVEHRLRWGNDWNGNGIDVENDPDEHFVDMPHWEIEGWKDIVDPIEDGW